MMSHCWYVNIPQCGYTEHGLKDIAHRAVCYNFPLVRDKPLGAPAFVILVYLTTTDDQDMEELLHATVYLGVLSLH